MDTDQEREDPFTLLMNMSQGGASMAGDDCQPSTSSGFAGTSYYMNEVALKGYDDSDLDEEDDEEDDDEEADEEDDTVISLSKSKRPLRKAVRAVRGKVKAKQKPTTTKKKPTAAAASKKGAPISKKRNSKEKGPVVGGPIPLVSPLMSIEEQKQLEEPIEIDMRDVYKTYGINPMEVSRMKSAAAAAGRTKQTISTSEAARLFIGEFRFKMAHGQGEADEALPMMFHYIRMYPQQTELLELVGEYYMGKGNKKRALDFFLLSVEWNQNDSKRWAQLADLATANGMFKSAVTFFDRAIRLEPRNPLFYLKKGKLLEQMKQWDGAVATYAKCLAIPMDFSDARDNSVALQNKFNIARILLHHKREPAKAQHVVEEALLLHPVESTPGLFARYLNIDFGSYCDILFKAGQPLKVLQKFLDYSIVKLDTFLLERRCSTLPEGSDASAESLAELIASSVDSFQFELPFRCARAVELELKSKFYAVFIYLRKQTFADHFLPEITGAVEAMFGEGGEDLEDDHDRNKNLPKTVVKPGAVALVESTYPALAEAFIAVGCFERAQKLLTRLLSVNETNAHYYYLSGLCLQHRAPEPALSEAIDAFERAILIDRNHYDAVQELSQICNQIGNPERALWNFSMKMEEEEEAEEDGRGTTTTPITTKISSTITTTTVDMKLWLSRCSLLYTCKRWAEYVAAVRILFSGDMYFFDRYSADLRQIIHPNMGVASMVRISRRLRKRFAKRQKTVGGAGTRAIPGVILTGGRLSPAAFLEHFRKVLFVTLHYLKDPGAAIRWAFSAWLSVHLEEHYLSFIVLLFRTCIDAKSKAFTYELGRYLLKEYPNSGQLWYAFSVAMADIYEDFRHKRYCMRMWNAHPENLNVLNMNGHIALLNGRYRDALAIFLLVNSKIKAKMEERKKSLNTGESSPENGDQPQHQHLFRYDTFYIGLCYLHMLMQNHTLDKCSLFAQMLTFFDDYVQKVGKCQETLYNVGRVYHQLGFLRHAAEMYTSALETPLKIYDRRFDLAPEVAFNLAQIYRKGGDHQRANRLIAQYCTI